MEGQHAIERYDRMMKSREVPTGILDREIEVAKVNAMIGLMKEQRLANLMTMALMPDAETHGLNAAGMKDDDWRDVYTQVVEGFGYGGDDHAQV